jgi:hypothetical protein
MPTEHERIEEAHMRELVSQLLMERVKVWPLHATGTTEDLERAMPDLERYFGMVHDAAHHNDADEVIDTLVTWLLATLAALARSRGQTLAEALDDMVNGVAAAEMTQWAEEDEAG